MRRSVLPALLSTAAILTSVFAPACNPSRPSTDALASARPVPSASSSAASTNDAPEKSGPAPASSMVNRIYFSTAGAPDPLACSQDSECIGDTVTRDDGCCVMSSEAVPQTWAWHTWLSNRRMSATCKAITCPALGPPSPPPACAFKLKCVAGKCKNSCVTPG